MLTLIYLLLILGVLIFIHELGHFIFAKKFNVHIYEFALGMGPRVLQKKGKDGIIYSLRAFPIGGFVQMAGEVSEDDKTVKKDRFMCNRPWIQRLIIMVAGVTFNLILALIVLFVSALLFGASNDKPIISELKEDYPVAKAGIVSGDTILEINGYKVKTWDKANIVLQMKDKDNVYEFVIEKTNGEKKEYKITPITEKDEEENERKVFGFSVIKDKKHGFVSSIEYAFTKFASVAESMYFVIINLFAGKLSLSALSGPVGMYSVVGDSVKYGLESVLYLIALLSINLGILNILPFPAFDGGRVLFMIIEKIKGSPINSKTENLIHSIGFMLLMALMLYITFQDILKLF